MQLTISNQTSDLWTGDPNPMNLPVRHSDSAGGSYVKQHWIGDFPPHEGYPHPQDIYHPNDILPYVPCPYPQPTRTWTTSTISIETPPCPWRVKKHKRSIELSADVPGVRARDINLDFDEGKLTVTAERFDTKESVLLTYDVGLMYNPATAKAILEAGVLTVRFGKFRKHMSRKITVEEK